MSYSLENLIAKVSGTTPALLSEYSDICTFEEMSPGTKFLCVSDWIIDFKSPKAKAYWQIQKDVNNGMDYVAAVTKANEFLKENE